MNHHTRPYTAQSCKTLFSHVYSPSENMHQPVLAHIQLIQNGSYLFSPVYSSFLKTRYYTSVTNNIAHLDWFIPILPHIQLIQKNQVLSIIFIMKSLQKSKLAQIYYSDPGPPIFRNKRAITPNYLSKIMTISQQEFFFWFVPCM